MMGNSFSVSHNNSLEIDDMRYWSLHLYKTVN